MLIAVSLAFGILAAAGILVAFWGFQAPGPDDVDLVEARLRSYESGGIPTIEEIELQKPFRERVLRPLRERLSGWLARNTPDKVTLELQRKLNLAGRPFGISAAELMTGRYAAGLAGGLLGLMAGAALGNVLVILVMTVVGAIVGLRLPDIWLSRRIEQRKLDIQVALPDSMDLLLVSVEAGLEFEAALAKVAEKSRSVLGEEFARVLHEIHLGRPRALALDDLGRRCGVEELHNFVQAVIQSEQLGTGIANILHLQSDEIRRRRLQRAQEKGARASLKMLLPMIAFIFPTLWIALLGPAGVMAWRAFAH